MRIMRWLALLMLVATCLAQAPNNTVIPPTFFGFTENTTSAGNFPTVTYGMQRFWDSPPLQWPSLNPSSGVFTFTNLDTLLAQDFSNGLTADMYTLARTPTWASSAPTDTTCNDTGGAPGEGDGECDPPSDLASNGSGTDAIWKAWITAIATHVNNPTYLLTHTPIRYWEIWNEPDTKAFFAGSIAQLARLTEDANCIITGRGVIHQSGNGTATACTATPIDPTAKIIMASAHAKVPALTYGQNELYCNNTSGIAAYELPCPNPANAISAAVDIINFHMKPGNETGNNCPSPTPCTPESAMQWYVANIHGILQTAELAKPLWDGEASCTSSGFSGTFCTDPDLAASFMGRFYLLDWSLGISGTAFYTWDQLSAESSVVTTAYTQIQSWMVGSVMPHGCSQTGTIFACGLTLQNGKGALAVWDNSKTCSGGICTTGSYTTAAQYTQFQTLASATPQTIISNTVALGIKPLLLLAQTPVITNPICGSPPCALTPGVQSAAYSFLLAATGGTAPYTFTISVGSLPAGLSLSSSGCGSNIGCAILGTPSGSGTTNFTVQVCDSVPLCATEAASLAIAAAGSVVVTNPTCGSPPCALNPGLQSTAYSFLLAASGGTAPYTFSISSGMLPAGLSLSSSGCGSNVNCNVQGTPLIGAVGTTTFSVHACDSLANCITLTAFVTVTGTSGGGGGSGGTGTNYILGDAGLAAAGSCAFQLQILSPNGGFTPSSVVNWNGSPRVTTFRYPRIVRVAITAADLAAGGTFAITVTTPPAAPAAVGIFTVVAGTPTITSDFMLGSTIAVNGTNFVPRNTQVLWSGTALFTTWYSPVLVQGWLPPGITSLGGGGITVNNSGCESDY
jgi:hypothetical protein